MASLLAGVCNVGSHYMQNQGGRKPSEDSEQGCKPTAKA